MVQINTATHPVGHPDRVVYRPPVWWGPVMAGAVSAIAIQFFFTVLGIAIGVTAADGPGGVDDGMGVVAGAWWLITGTLSLVIGGVVVGLLMGPADNLVVTLHSVAMWGLVALFGFLVIWSGAGMATEAASPLTAITGERADTGLPVQSREDAAISAGNGTRSFENQSVNPDEARDVAQASAWWSVVGLLLGVAASAGGAAIGVRRWRHPS